MNLRFPLLLVSGIGQGVATYVYLLACIWVLDEFTSDTTMGIVIQILPFLILAFLFGTYPFYLFLKKRPSDAVLFSAAAMIGVAILIYLIPLRVQSDTGWIDTVRMKEPLSERYAVSL